MTDDRVKCSSRDCEQMIVPARRPSLFCWSCESLLERQRAELATEIDRVLHDEAAFIAWCQEHGHPHPHED